MVLDGGVGWVSLLVCDGLDDAALVDAAGIGHPPQLGGLDPWQQGLRQARLVLGAHHELTCGPGLSRQGSEWTDTSAGVGKSLSSTSQAVPRRGPQQGRAPGV